MAGTTTLIKLDAQLVDEAMRVLGAKSRTEVVHMALLEIVWLRHFKKLMKKHAGKHKFQGYGG
jgi:Arc/MetJ family transcription regulator